MAGEKLQVLWSPNRAEEFATYGNELKVYTIQNTSSKQAATELHLSDKHYGRLLAYSSEPQCIPMYKTVAWQPNKANSHCFAIGQSNGRVSLISLLPRDPSINPQNHHLSTRTLGRTSHCVAWNPTDNKLLAQGLEKTRTDSSLIVWDVTRASTTTSGSRQPTGSIFSKSGGPPSDSLGPSDETGKFFETGNGESTNCISWIPAQPNCLVAGMGSTYLKIFDIRDDHSSKEPRAYAQNKAIYGLAVDPSSPHQIASFAKGNTVYLWDTRSFKGPVYSFQRPGNVVQLAWTSTRPGCLSIVLSEAPYLRLVNIPFISQTPDTADTYQDYLTNHINDRFPLVPRGSKKPVVNLEWHSEWTNTGLYVNSDGVVKELNVCDKIPVTWSSHDPMVYAVNGELFSVCTINGSVPLLQERETDIASLMLKRVKKGYGFDPALNIGLFEERSSLHQVWSWINERISNIGQNDRSKRVGGVNADLESLGSSEEVAPSLTECPSPLYPTYSNPQRTRALRLCGWSFIADNKLEEFVKREEMNERFERAAAIAVFLGNIKLAISLLRDGATHSTPQLRDSSKSDLNLIALSLAGYSSEPSLWQETCSSIKKQIGHPYLRVIFSFLSAGKSPEGISAVLGDSAVALQDRVALACMYLNDKKLKDYLAIESRRVIDGGKIEGLFLTGLDESGIGLLENYVNKTGDVQSACLITGQNLSVLSKSNPLVSVWFDGYRDLLDRWQLWKERALFDQERKSRDQSHKPLRQASVLCTFCSKAISNDMLRQDVANKSKKSTSCPSCRKPLPRCSLCLLHMVAGNSKGRDYSFPNQSDQFGQWFTWCQTCRHGGHATHMTDWFRSHEVCPVTDCTCHCMSLDCLN